MSLQGNTLFAGDSITVGLPPFVKVDGVKTRQAVGGIPAAGLLKLMKTTSFDGVVNLVVLIGTNDLGSGAAPEKTFQTIEAIWRMGKDRGVRVFALTIPPVKGWPSFAVSFAKVEAQRQALNAFIKASPIPDVIIDNSALLADRSDPERLAASADSGDHLHPRKDVHGTLLSVALGASDSRLPAPSQALATNGEPFPWLTVFLLVGVVAGGTILLARKDAFGDSLATNILHKLS